jgi:hypothetical protein
MRAKSEIDAEVADLRKETQEKLNALKLEGNQASIVLSIENWNKDKALQKVTLNDDMTLTLVGRFNSSDLYELSEKISSEFTY